MPAIVRTFTTRIDSHSALTARAKLESRVERKLYAALKSGRKFTGDLAISFYQQFDISAKTLDGIHRQLKAKLNSIAELAKLRAAEIEIRIAAKRKQIADVEKALHRKRPPEAVVRHRLRFALHQHKRRLAILERRLAEAKGEASEPRIYFGSRSSSPPSIISRTTVSTITRTGAGRGTPRATRSSSSRVRRDLRAAIRSHA